MLTAALLACALNVAPATMEAVILVEHGSPFALNVNHLVGRQPHPATVQEAIAAARRYIAAGYTVDMGWSQLNSANLVRFDYSVEDAYDECKNVAAGGAVLYAFYGKAVQRFGEGQPALMHAISGYNTGDIMTAGFLNGYVGKYYTVPSLSVLPLTSRIMPTALSRHASDTEIWE